MMKSRFDKWYKANAERELLDFYCEGSMCDMPMITKIEQLMERAYEAGSRETGLGVYRGTDGIY